MTEKYSGVKFRTILERKDVPYDEGMKELIFWCKKFDELGLTPKHTTGSHGNLSFRIDDGFIITASGKNMSKVSVNDFVKVTECNKHKKEVYATGLVEPSSESFLHWLIYQTRKDVNAIFHGHDKEVLERSDQLSLVKTEKEQPYGTIELAEEVLKVLDENDYIVITSHGFLSLGNSMKEAGERAVRIHESALQK